MEFKAHTTPGGKLALSVTDDGLTDKKYVVGGYKFYVVAGHLGHFNFKTQQWEPTLSLSVYKRTRSLDVALRERRNNGSYRTQAGTVHQVVILERLLDGTYRVI